MQHSHCYASMAIYITTRKRTEGEHLSQVETQSGFFSFTKTRQRGARGCIGENRGYRQWEASSRKASLIFFNEHKQEKRCYVLLHASACRGQVFSDIFFLQPPPEGHVGVQQVMLAATESFISSVLRLRTGNLQTHCQSPTKAFAFNINLGHVEKTHATSRLCAVYMVFPCLKLNSSRHSGLLFVTFNIAAIVCDDRKERKRSGGERRISGFLS